jgi:predicted nucleic acid-binding protein
MIYLLDTNVLSEWWKPNSDPKVVAFLEGDAEWFLPAPVIAEIQEGAELAAKPARRVEINSRLDTFLGIYPQAVLPWDTETARTWGRLNYSAEVKLKPQSLWDSLIDAMAVRYHATIATRNRADFRHATTFDPWVD